MMEGGDTAAFLRKYASNRFDAQCAGLESRGMNPFTNKVMDEIGMDVSAQTPKGIGTYLGKVQFLYQITVCDDLESNCPTVWPGVNQRLHWSFEDPAKFEGTEEEKLAKFCQVRGVSRLQMMPGSLGADSNTTFETVIN